MLKNSSFNKQHLTLEKTPAIKVTRIYSRHFQLYFVCFFLKNSNKQTYKIKQFCTSISLRDSILITRPCRLQTAEHVQQTHLTTLAHINTTQILSIPLNFSIITSYQHSRIFFYFQSITSCN